MKKTPLIQILKGRFHCEKLPFDLFIRGIDGGQIYKAGEKLHGTIISKIAKNFDRLAVAHDGTPESYKTEAKFWCILAKELVFDY
mgnify:FL=1|tara:strand:- start:1153 stop:1407 length:255 start_codon:yes stop_codon:yes gene_type:complete